MPAPRTALAHAPLRWTRCRLWCLIGGVGLAGCGDPTPSSAASGGGGGAISAGGGGSASTASSQGGSGGVGLGEGGGGTGGAGGAGGAPGSPVTLLSLNLHCFQLGGTSFASNADRFAAIVDFAVTRGVDAMAVQEACERPGEDAMGTLREGLSAATGQPWSSEWAFAHVAWEGTPDEADEGVGLLIRGAASGAITLDHAVQGALRRVAVSARLPETLGGARVMSIHFEVFEPAARAAQAREAAAAALAGADPLFDAVVAGDFNDVEGSPAWSAFPAMGYLPADQGLSATGIDHVMIHRAAPLRPTMVEEVLDGMQAVSDHPGILVRLEPAPGDPLTVTRISTQVDPGSGHFLSVRGDTAPLSWDIGSPMTLSAQAGRVLVLTELEGPFELKVLRDDTDWQQGPNVPGIAGTDLVVTPMF